ncbi:POL1 protein, partial [Ciconia maguari]|nr:POL1 protein [Ciconia maguari]
LNLEPRVLDTPREGPTLFTDALSRMNRAVVVWKEGDEWQEQTWEGAGMSVQFLEAKAVSMALNMHRTSHINVVTDSMYVYKLVQSMSRGSITKSEIASMLDSALQLRSGTVTLIHTLSHQRGPGPIIEGNRRADKIASQQEICTVCEAAHLHEHLHIGAKALAKATRISLNEARRVVAACPQCQS